MWSAATKAAVHLWFLPETPPGLSAPPPALGRLSPSLETEVEPVENPIDETTTVAEMLRRPTVSAEPQVFGTAPFRMAMGPERMLRCPKSAPGTEIWLIGLAKRDVSMVSETADGERELSEMLA
jgi:hypothetical protein